MKTEFIFHSGLDTIGGVILEIRYGLDRCFFEAGTAYNPSFDMFDSKVMKRNNFIKDYIWVNEIPMIDYIYRKEDIINYDIKPVEENIYNQAFFISHLHLDHMRMMGMISPLVPIYLSKPAEILEKILEEIGLGVDTVRDNYLDIPNEVNIGKIKVKKFILNKDSYQDLSFYIETPDVKCHFTGDIFAYGVYKGNLKLESNFLKDEKIDILFSEGTQFWGYLEPKRVDCVHSIEEDENSLSKEEFDSNNIEIIKNTDKLIILNYYEREISDVIDYERFAKAAGRTIVYEPESAYIINKFMKQKVTFMIPDTMNEEPKYLKYVIDNNILIKKEEILKNQNKYIVVNSYPNLMELLDYKDINAIYLHHSGLPLGTFDPKYKNLMSILKLCNIEYVSSKISKDNRLFSPHATIPQILGYIDMVNPKLVVPCHSANRKMYSMNLDRPHFMCELKKTYEYDRERNTLKEV